MASNRKRKTQPSLFRPTAARPDHDAAAEMLRRLRSGGDLRTRKIRRLRAAVRASRYENDLKLAIALEKLMRELSSDSRGPSHDGGEIA